MTSSALVLHGSVFPGLLLHLAWPEPKGAESNRARRSDLSWLGHAQNWEGQMGSFLQDDRAEPTPPPLCMPQTTAPSSNSRDTSADGALAGLGVFPSKQLAVWGRRMTLVRARTWFPSQHPEVPRLEKAGVVWSPAGPEETWKSRFPYTQEGLGNRGALINPGGIWQNGDIEAESSKTKLGPEHSQNVSHQRWETSGETQPLPACHRGSPQ